MTFLTEGLDQSAIALLMRSALYPYVRAVHFLGAALTVGGIILVDLRILGIGRAVSLDAVRSLTMRWIWTGFFLAVSAGALLFLAQPAALFENGALRLKLALLVAAGANAFFFEKFAIAKDTQIGLLARGSAAISLLLWSSVLLFSSLIPYWGF